MNTPRQIVARLRTTKKCEVCKRNQATLGVQQGRKLVLHCDHCGSKYHDLVNEVLSESFEE